MLPRPHFCVSLTFYLSLFSSVLVVEHQLYFAFFSKMNSVPLEIQFAILAKCDYRTKAIASTVCSAWHEELENPKYWKGIEVDFVAGKNRHTAEDFLNFWTTIENESANEAIRKFYPILYNLKTRQIKRFKIKGNHQDDGDWLKVLIGDQRWSLGTVSLDWSDNANLTLEDFVRLFHWRSPITTDLEQLSLARCSNLDRTGANSAYYMLLFSQFKNLTVLDISGSTVSLAHMVLYHAIDKRTIKKLSMANSKDPNHNEIRTVTISIKDVRETKRSENHVLQELDISGCNWLKTKDLFWLSPMTGKSLTLLNISNNPQIRPEILHSLHGFTALKTLYTSGCGFYFNSKTLAKFLKLFPNLNLKQ